MTDNIYGFFNQGNTCYLNTTLQILFSLPEVVNRLNNSTEILSILNEIYCDPSKIKNTGKLINYISRKYNFLQGTQQDSNELLILMIDDMKINDLFELNEKKITICKNCNKSINLKDQKHINIYVEGKTIDSYRNYIKKLFYKESEIDDFKGSKCGCSEMITKSVITNISNILIVQINDIFSIRMAEKSLTDYSSFPDISEIGYVNYEKEKSVYKLVGKVNHYGSSLNSGHYNANIIKNINGYNYNLLADDSSITNTGQDNIKIDENTYYLIYRKTQ